MTKAKKAREPGGRKSLARGQWLDFLGLAGDFLEGREPGSFESGYIARALLAGAYFRFIDSTKTGGKENARLVFAAAYNSGELYPRLFLVLGPVTPRTLDRWVATLRTGAPNDLGDKRGRHERKDAPSEKGGQE